MLPVEVELEHLIFSEELLDVLEPPEEKLSALEIYVEVLGVEITIEKSCVPDHPVLFDDPPENAQ